VTGLAARLVRLGRGLRAAGAPVVLRDEIDAAEALGLVDTADREEVRRTLRVALKVRPEAFGVFDRLFAAFWSGEEAPAPPPRAVEAPRVPPMPAWRWDPDARRLGEAPGGAGEGRQPGYSPQALLRRRRFDDASLSAAEVAAMERLLVRLARRLATRRSRRLVPTRGRGAFDLRRSLRRALGTQGEPLSLARRARALTEPRLVFLCDTSGSMDRHSRFLLAFALALRRAARRSEVFAFNTELVRVTPWLARGGLEAVLARLAAAVPDWSGGTRIGECLQAFLEVHGRARLDARTVVVILSDGLDRGEPQVLADALREVRRRARRVVWLNPLLGDPRYEPTARGMQAALPFVDHFAPAHDLPSLERLLPRLAV
jgi:uncharacterized protein